MKRTLIVLTLLLWLPTSQALAQLVAAKDGPIVYGHHHLNVTSADEHKKFWVNALGGVAVMIGNPAREIIKFPNALVFLNVRPPTGPTKGSTMNHIGFSVPSLRPVIEKVKANGFRMVTAEEAPAGIKVENDIGLATGGDVSGIAYAMGPDGVKVELVEIKKQTAPIMSHHIHFFGAQQKEMHDWYMKVFGAKDRPGLTGTFIGADLPGLGLNFSPSTEPVVTTRGRAIDHIGFEVKNLEAFTKNLTAQGIMLDRPYTKVEALGISIAFITDPWGTYIELTEGLDKVN